MVSSIHNLLSGFPQGRENREKNYGRGTLLLGQKSGKSRGTFFQNAVISINDSKEGESTVISTVQKNANLRLKSKTFSK